MSDTKNENDARSTGRGDADAERLDGEAGGPAAAVYARLGEEHGHEIMRGVRVECGDGESYDGVVLLGFVDVDGARGFALRHIAQPIDWPAAYPSPLPSRAGYLEAPILDVRIGSDAARELVARINARAAMEAPRSGKAGSAGPVSRSAAAASASAPRATCAAAERTRAMGRLTNDTARRVRALCLRMIQEGNACDDGGNAQMMRMAHASAEALTALLSVQRMASLAGRTSLDGASPSPGNRRLREHARELAVVVLDDLAGAMFLGGAPGFDLEIRGLRDRIGAAPVDGEPLRPLDADDDDNDLEAGGWTLASVSGLASVSANATAND